MGPLGPHTARFACFLSFNQTIVKEGAVALTAMPVVTTAEMIRSHWILALLPPWLANQISGQRPLEAPYHP